MKRAVLIFTAFILLCPQLHARPYKERAFQEAWCRRAGGVTEYALPDRTRVDCLTGDFAVEVDFAHKWAEAVGQALYYSFMTKRKPGILLIMEDEGDRRFLERAQVISKRLGITVWTVEAQEMEGR